MNSPDKRSLHIFLKSHSYSRTITYHTRVTSKSTTTIDYIWCNSEDKYAHRGCLDPDLCAHALIQSSPKCVKPSREKKRQHLSDVIISFDTSACTHDIAVADWRDVYAKLDVDQATSIFHFILISIINTHLP